MVYKRLTLSIILLIVTFSTNAQTIAVPDGYAGYAGTTGGAGGDTMVVTTVSDFESAVKDDNPKIVIVKGRLNVGDIKIGSNKTIIGFDSNSGLYGGVVGVRGSNYIFQGLTFGPSGSDDMEVSGAQKVFITKCTFYNSSDELLSVVRGADYVTISWCKFYFTSSGSHNFAHLIGNRDDRTSDRGKLHVTLHHNWYSNNIKGRMPRVRYGQVHIYNCYYNSIGNDYCIGLGVECHIRVESCYFEKINDAWADYGGVSKKNGEIG